ncbi:Crp/Fnr family transcriptional regulator [Peptococcus simiae]|uniref:Crp/Fnr family transcriptional regulator n=1 Tax=Peptococcus simiae TaxID=1643805 RepID=UPI0039816F9B
MDLSFLCQDVSAKQVSFSKGEYIIHQGDQLTHVYYISQGICERIEYAEDGNEILFSTKTSTKGLEALVGLNNLWNPSPYSISSFRAITNLTCWQIDAANAKKHLSASTSILNAIVAMQAKNYISLRRLFKSHHERRVPSLVCHFLLDHAKADKGNWLVPKNYTNAAIGRHLGVHPVTISRVLTFLRKRSILTRTEKGLYIINRQKLETYANDKKMPYKET